MRIRTLAIDVTNKGLCWVVLEETDRLVDWGCAQVDKKTDSPFVRRVDALLSRFGPDLVVVEAGHDSRRGRRAQRLIARIRERALARRIALCSVSRAQVRAAFPELGNKHDIATEIANRFPELAPRLPRPRKPWMSEDERMNLYDAMGFGLVALSRLEDMRTTHRVSQPHSGESSSHNR